MNTQGNSMKTLLAIPLVVATLWGQSCTTQTQFNSPDAAAQALWEAVEANDTSRIIKMMGKDSQKWLFSGDNVIDETNRKHFAQQYQQKHLLKQQSSQRYHLVVGNDEWPFAAPIVACQKTWSFDSAAANQEIINRRIGDNELNTIQTLLAIVDAQREYATHDLDSNGIHDYAKKLLSSPGQKDGLYWKSDDGVKSPLGILVANASKEGYTKHSSAFHGYTFKTLTSQGGSAKGGKYSYIVNDKMIGGFAVLATPAKYGSSGIMSFIVNHDGIVYQKDLGKKSSKIAASIKTFNPDKSWSNVQ